MSGEIKSVALSVVAGVITAGLLAFWNRNGEPMGDMKKGRVEA